MIAVVVVVGDMVALSVVTIVMLIGGDRLLHLTTVVVTEMGTEIDVRLLLRVTIDLMAIEIVLVRLAEDIESKVGFYCEDRFFGLISGSLIKGAGRVRRKSGAGAFLALRGNMGSNMT